MGTDALDIRPLSGALGAEILGIDLSHDLGDETVAAIRAAWLEHLVVFFRAQTLARRSFCSSQAASASRSNIPS
jgi:taurine dioxygenase